MSALKPSLLVLLSIWYFIVTQEIDKEKVEEINDLEPDVKIIKANSVSNYPNLKKFWLTNHSVEEIEPGAFTNVPNLTRIGIMESHLKEIPEGVFNHLEVVSLNFSNNDITTIAPKAFDDMPKLESIVLDRNNLTEWDANWFHNTLNLRHINFYMNHITELPDQAFKNIQNEQACIHFVANSIRQLGSQLFGETKKINWLDLRNNEIEEVDENVFTGFERMDMLDLSDNKITCISGDFNKIFVAEFTMLYGNPFEKRCKRKIEKWIEKEEEEGNYYLIDF